MQGGGDWRTRGDFRRKRSHKSRADMSVNTRHIQVFRNSLARLDTDFPATGQHSGLCKLHHFNKNDGKSSGQGFVLCEVDRLCLLFLKLLYRGYYFVTPANFVTPLLLGEQSLRCLHRLQHSLTVFDNKLFFLLVVGKFDLRLIPVFITQIYDCFVRRLCNT